MKDLLGMIQRLFPLRGVYLLRVLVVCLIAFMQDCAAHPIWNQFESSKGDDSNLALLALGLATSGTAPLNLIGLVTSPFGPAEGVTAAADDDGVGNAARFNNPHGIASDGTYLYVAESGNHKIRRIDLGTGSVVTIAGPPAGSNGFGDTDGVGTASRFLLPIGITYGNDTLYVADGANNKIRSVTLPSVSVSTPFGPAQGTTTGGDNDATGNSARFSGPSGIAISGTNVYVVDLGSHRIRQIDLNTGAVTTLVGPGPGSSGTGDTDGVGTAARFNAPLFIAIAGDYLYVTEGGNNKIRRVEISTRTVSTFAGPPEGSTAPGDTDGTGNAARFNGPAGILSDGTYLYVADSGNHRIRRIEIATAEVTTLAGPAAGSSGMGDTDGTGTNARFNEPRGLATDGVYLYVTEFENDKIRRIE